MLKYLVALIFLLVIPGCYYFAAFNHYYTGPISDHFDGLRFFDPHEPYHKNLIDVIKWRWQANRPIWPNKVENKQFDHPPIKVKETGQLRVSYVGHLTFLIQINGLNILTDPIWSERASPVSFAGPKRVIDPGIRFEDLPPIDVIWISHNHYDHLDLATL